MGQSGRFAFMEYFGNNQVDVSLLPKAEDISFQPIEKEYWKIMKWSWMITWSIILLTGVMLFAFIPGLRTVQSGLLLIPALAICLLSFWLMKKSFVQKGFAVREKDLLYKSGWLIQSISAIPFNRIQHCSVSSGILERTQGLASLSIFTAGASGSDLKIHGLKSTTANEMKDFIMTKIKTDEHTVG